MFPQKQPFDFDEEKRQSQAPKIFPYPLAHITDRLVDIFEAIGNTRGDFITAINYPNMSEKEMEILKKELDMLDKIAKRVKVMSDNIEALKF